MEHRTLAAVAHSLGLSGGFADVTFCSAVTDSRSVNKGDIFFALTGAKTDGHNYLADVAGQGAIAAVVLETYSGPHHGMTLFKVPNVLAALQKLAKNRIAAWRPPIVAVTGSVGKTTTKEFIATLLSSRYNVGKAPGNANSQVGLAVTIVNLSGQEDVLVLEMGMTEAGQIAKLVEIAPPTLAVITKIGMAHAGNFSNGIEGVAAAKAEILAHPRTTLAIIGADAHRFDVVRVTGSCAKLIAGQDFVLIQDGDTYRIKEKEGLSPSLHLPFSASHFLENFSLAAAVARAMGLRWEEILPQLPSLQSTGSRFAQTEIAGTIFINDAYNAGPESVRAALDNLPLPKKGGRKIAVLGGMTIDLGPTSDSIHREVAHHALKKADHFFCYGPGAPPMKEVFEEAGKLCCFTEDLEELRARVFAFVQPGDVVLVKGANRYAMWKLLEIS